MLTNACMYALPSHHQAGIATGSGKPATEKVGKVTKAQVEVSRTPLQQQAGSSQECKQGTPASFFMPHAAACASMWRASCIHCAALTEYLWMPPERKDRDAANIGRVEAYFLPESKMKGPHFPHCFILVRSFCLYLRPGCCQVAWLTILATGMDLSQLHVTIHACPPPAPPTPK
jgi:hypothetical protein